MNEFKARPSRADLTVLVVVLGGISLSLIIWAVAAVVRSRNVGSGDLVPVPFVAWAGLLGWRLAGAYCLGHGQEVVIRNYFPRTKRVPVSEIRGLDIGSSRAGVITIRVLTFDRVIPVDVFCVVDSGPRRKRERDMAQLECRKQELTDWIAAASGRTSR